VLNRLSFELYELCKKFALQFLGVFSSPALINDASVNRADHEEVSDRAVLI